METEDRNPTIAEAAWACHRCFATCLERTASLNAREQSLAEDQLGRFSMWTSNIDVFAPGRASMDYRLRGVPDIHRLVRRLLGALEECVRQCSSIFEDEDFERARLGSLEERERFINDKFDPSIHAIAEDITLLHQLSNTIRKAGKESQDLKAAKTFKIKDDEGNNLEDVLQKQFADNLLDQFPEVSDKIRERLVSTMLLRRKRILYRRSRHAKAPIRAPETIQQPKVPPRPIQSQSTIQPILQGEIQLDENITPTQIATKSIIDSEINTATTLDPEKFKRASNPSIISRTQTVAFSQHEKLAFPAPPGAHITRKFKGLETQRKVEYQALLKSLEGYPPDIAHEQRIIAERDLKLALEKDRKACKEAIIEVICPYCFWALPSSEVNDERKWRQHVKDDLDPYVCLFEDCNSPEELYRHSHEWLKHMTQHALRWRCNIKDHRDYIFESRVDYETHMKGFHSTSINDAQLVLLSKRNARFTGPIFESCPLCGFADTVLESRTLDHIVGHMRALALKSLPRIDDELDDDDDSKEGSGSAKPPSRSTLKNEEIGHISLDFKNNDDLTFEITEIWETEPYRLSQDRETGDHILSRDDDPNFLRRVSPMHLRQAEWGFVPDLYKSSNDQEPDLVLRSFMEKGAQSVFPSTEAPTLAMTIEEEYRPPSEGGKGKGRDIFRLDGEPPADALKSDTLRTGTTMPSYDITSREDFDVAVICSLVMEANAVEAMFDEVLDSGPFGREAGDKNIYTLGRIGHHHVVLAWMPAVGKGIATVVAGQLQSSFRKIKLVLVVGICGGVPYMPDGMEILLGDVVISTALITDGGKQYPTGYSKENAMNIPDLEMRSLLNKLARSLRLRAFSIRYMTDLLKTDDFSIVRYPGAHEDKRYRPNYLHNHHDRLSCTICDRDMICSNASQLTCEELRCEEKMLVAGPRLKEIKEFAAGDPTKTKIPPSPYIHFGMVASTNTVMKSGQHRDEIAKRLKVIAFDMEAAGVIDVYPSAIVIKGVCDYADGHRNKMWQAYAAVTAAASMKAFLKLKEEAIPSWGDRTSKLLKPILARSKDRKIEWA